MLNYVPFYTKRHTLMNSLRSFWFPRTHLANGHTESVEDKAQMLPDTVRALGPEAETPSVVLGRSSGPLPL